MRRVVSFLALALAAPPLAAAQTLPRDTTAPLLLPGLSVTVLSTPIEVNRAPYAVAVSTQEEIQRGRPGLGLDEALRAIPGVQVDNRFNYALGERISIRGFGARAQFGVRGVRVLVDGVPATFPDGQTSLSHVDLGFLSRAEVVRGPASALYGSSAGGVVRFETEEAPSTPLGQRVGVMAGSDGLLRLQSTTGGRRGRTAYLLNLSRVTYDGYRTHNGAENNRVNARLEYLGDTDELRFSLSLVDYDADNPGSLSDSLLRVDRSAAFANNVRQGTGEAGRQGQAGLTWRRPLAGGAVTATAYGIARSVDNPIPNTIVVLDRAVGGVRASWAKEAPRFAWSVGAEGAVDRDHRENFANQQGERGALTLDQDEGVDNAALFAQARAFPLGRLTALGSLRYDWYRFTADDRRVSDTDPDDSGEITMSSLSPSAGVSFQVARALNLYANVATAFETPTTTELANRPSGAGGFNPELEPQTAVSYEIGAKGSLGGWARYEAAAYHADVDDELISFEVPGAPGRSYFRNAGSGTHRGVELGVHLAPAPWVQLRGGYTYTDARFDDYVAPGGDFSGNRLPGVAPRRAELALTVNGPAGIFAGLEGRHTSELPVNDANSVHSPASTVVDLRAGMVSLRLAGLALEPYGGITNLLDEEYNTSVVINAFGRRFYEPGPPRSLYLGLDARFER